MDIPVELSRILITELGDSQIIFLKEIDGERTFPILIGLFEAKAIDDRLKGVKFPRPLTHDLLANTISAMGGTIEKVLISDLRDHTFIASLFVRRDGEVIEIDARPSDAIALATGTPAPIFVADKVFELIMGSGPQTRQGRLELLRQRSEILAEQIKLLQEMLDDKSFRESISQDEADDYFQQLEQMQTERQAITEILNRLK